MNRIDCAIAKLRTHKLSTNLMTIPVNLKKIGENWEFNSETDLEDFVWQNLLELLGLRPLERQYQIKVQRCDILAIAENKQLVIIELKNIEDRYIVQQLTRYYHVLLEEKPFVEQVDYNCPIHLIAIAPSFHRDNFIDTKYHRLSFSLLEFKLIELDNLYFDLVDIETGKIYTQTVGYGLPKSNNAISNLPKKLQKLLNQYEPDKQERILKIRQKIFIYDQSLEEDVSKNSIHYGRFQNKIYKSCAEILFDGKGDSILFLWLPLKNLKSDKIGRYRLWTDWEKIALIEGCVTSGIGQKISIRKRSIRTLIDKILQAHQSNNSAKSFFKRGEKFVYMATDRSITNQYCKEYNAILKKLIDLKPITDEEVELFHLFKDENYQLAPSPYRSLDELLNIALEKWRERI